jgi:hypothetical protein
VYVFRHFFVFLVGMNHAMDIPNPVEKFLLGLNYFRQGTRFFLAGKELDFFVFFFELLTKVVKQRGVQAVDLVQAARLRAGEEISRVRVWSSMVPVWQGKVPVAGRNEAQDVITRTKGHIPPSARAPQPRHLSGEGPQPITPLTAGGGRSKQMTTSSRTRQIRRRGAAQLADALTRAQTAISQARTRWGLGADTVPQEAEAADGVGYTPADPVILDDGEYGDARGPMGNPDQPPGYDGEPTYTQDEYNEYLRWRKETEPQTK